MSAGDMTSDATIEEKLMVFALAFSPLSDWQAWWDEYWEWRSVSPMMAAVILCSGGKVRLV